MSLKILETPKLCPRDVLARDRVRLKTGLLILENNAISTVWDYLKIDTRSLFSLAAATGTVSLIAQNYLGGAGTEALIKTVFLATCLFMAYKTYGIFNHLDARFELAKDLIGRNLHLFPKSDKEKYVLYYNHEKQSALLFNPNKKALQAFEIYPPSPKIQLNLEKLQCLITESIAYERPVATGVSFFYTRTQSATSPYSGNSPLGYVFDRPIIFGDSSINEGVYFNVELPLIVDERFGPELEDAYRNMNLNEFDGNIPEQEENIIKKVFFTVRELLFNHNDPLENDNADTLILIPLQKFIEASAGVCRHQALLVAYFLEKAQRENILYGQFLLQSYCGIDENTNGHVFVIYFSKTGVRAIIDVAASNLFSTDNLENELFKHYIRYLDLAKKDGDDCLRTMKKL